MKKLLLLMLLASAAWWYFVGGRRLSEAQVREFYREVEVATLARNPEALCAFLADDFHGSGHVTLGGRRRETEQDKAQACLAYKDLYASWDKLGAKMGGMLQLDAQYTLHRITIASDRKSAVVEISTSLDVAGSIMNIRARSTETLVRRNGKLLLLRSEGSGLIRSAP